MESNKENLCDDHQKTPRPGNNFYNNGWWFEFRIVTPLCSSQTFETILQNCDYLESTGEVCENMTTAFDAELTVMDIKSNILLRFNYYRK